MFRSKTLDRLSQMLDEMIRQTEKLEFLIQSLTKISRLEADIVEVRPKHQEISALLAEAGSGRQKRKSAYGTFIPETAVPAMT